MVEGEISVDGVDDVVSPTPTLPNSPPPAPAAPLYIPYRAEIKNDITKKWGKFTLKETHFISKLF